MKYLDFNPEIASGHLVIKGTRIRVAHVLKLMLEGQAIEEIHSEWYPWLSLSKLKGAVEEAISQISVPLHA